MSGIRNKMLDGLYKIYDCSAEGTEEGKQVGGEGSILHWID